MISGTFIDAGLTGWDGAVRVFVMLGDEAGEAVVLWEPEFNAPRVLSASSPLVEAFVHQDHETQDYVEELHSRYVAEHRSWRGGWVHADEVEA